MLRLAIDLGSSVTKIYRVDSGSGIVLAEPSCVAVDCASREVKAVGKDAKKLVGKTAEFTEILFPVYEGEITDVHLAGEMLKAFLRKINAKASVWKRSEIIFPIPCGADTETKMQYRLLADECGLRKIRFAQVPFLSAIGSDAVLSGSEPVFTIDIGGGTTNIAVVSSYGVIAGLSMNLGGNNMDANIIDRIAQTKQLQIGPLSAERIKIDVGSLSQSARATTVAEGSHTQYRRPSSTSVCSNEIYDCIRIYIDKIIEYASLVLKELPAEVSASVNQNGLFLSGGVAKLSSLSEYIAQKLDMRVHVCKEPQFAVIMGAGTALRDKELLSIVAPVEDV